MKYFSLIIFRAMLFRYMVFFLICILVTYPGYILVGYIILSQRFMIGQPAIDVLEAAFYGAPSLMLSVVPVVIGSATMFWLVYAESSKQLIKMEILGSQVRKIILSMALVIFTLTSFAVLLLESPISEMYKKSNNIIKNASQDSVKTSLTEEGVWIRRFEGDKISITYAEKFDRGEQTASNISFYLITRDHKFVQRLSAKKAVLKDGYWLMQDGMEILPQNATTFFQERKLPSMLTLAEVIGSVQPPRGTSLWEMRELEDVLTKNGLPAFEYSNFFYHVLFLPLFAAGMVLLVSYSMLFSMRKYSIVVGIAWGLGTLVLVSFAVRMPHALGEAAIVSPLVGNVLPPLVFLILGLTLMLRQER